MSENTQTTIVVGVTPHQPETVVREAAHLARALSAALVCAYVDPAAYVVAERDDGSVDARPVDPDGPDWTEPPFDHALAARLARIATEEGVPLQLRGLAGDVARALGRLAETLGSQLLVVGSRSGAKATVQEYFGGSVAVHLAHRQSRPVLIVPLAAQADGPLPWEDEA